jgi:hypothetical protein
MVFSIKRKRLNGHNHLPDGHESPDPGKRKKILLVILLFMLLASNLMLFSRLMKSRTTILYQQQVLANVQEPPDASSEVNGKWYGLCEKNSIHSINDFLNIVENDPVLSRHFSDFDWKNARMGTLEQSAWTHLAYRKNQKISTTRRAIRLPKGDGYITDGKRWLRTFCCNDYVLASTPGPPAVPTEDGAAAPGPWGPDDPEKDLDRIAKMPPVPNSPPNQLVEPPGTPPRVVPHSIAVVPEPSPFILMGVGMVILGLMSILRRRMKDKDGHAGITS